MRCLADLCFDFGVPMECGGDESPKVLELFKEWHVVGTFVEVEVFWEISCFTGFKQQRREEHGFDFGLGIS